MLGIINGEDENTIFFILSLSFILSLIVFSFNFGVTFLTLKSIKNSRYHCLAFIAPLILAILLFIPINDVLNNIDFGIKNLYWIIFAISGIVNIVTFIKLKDEVKLLIFF